MSLKKQAIEALLNGELTEHKVCGACGEAYEVIAEGDSQGFHSVKFCLVRADEELN